MHVLLIIIHYHILSYIIMDNHTLSCIIIHFHTLSYIKIHIPNWRLAFIMSSIPSFLYSAVSLTVYHGVLIQCMERFHSHHIGFHVCIRKERIELNSQRTKCHCWNTNMAALTPCKNALRGELDGTMLPSIIAYDTLRPWLQPESRRVNQLTTALRASV